MDAEKDTALDSFIRYLSAERNVSPNTVKAYACDISQFLNYIERAGVELREVDHKLIRRYLAFLQNFSLSRSSLARKIAAIRAFFKYLHRHLGRLDANPASLVSPAKTPKALPKIMRPEDIEALFGLPDTRTAAGQRDSAILEVLYGAGIRVAELTALDLKDLGLAAGELRVFGKGSKERIVPINGPGAFCLERYLGWGRTELVKKSKNRSDAVFLNKYGDRIGTGAVRRLVKAYANKCGLLNNVTPHAFRHTFATHLLEGGASLRAVQELLGHVDLSSTQIYTHLGKSKLRQAYLLAHPRA